MTPSKEAEKVLRDLCDAGLAILPSELDRALGIIQSAIEEAVEAYDSSIDWEKWEQAEQNANKNADTCASLVSEMDELSRTTVTEKENELRSQLAAAVEALEELPEKLLQSQKTNPAWSKAALWGIERDIVPAIRLLTLAALAKCQQKGGDASCEKNQQQVKKTSQSNAAPTVQPAGAAPFYNASLSNEAQLAESAIKQPKQAASSGTESAQNRRADQSKPTPKTQSPEPEP